MVRCVCGALHALVESEARLFIPVELIQSGCGPHDCQSRARLCEGLSKDTVLDSSVCSV